MPVAGAAIAAGGSLIGGNQQANAANDAANAGAQGSRDSIAAQLAFYNQNRQDNYGGMVLQNGAMQRIAQMYGLPSYGGMPSWDGPQMSGGQTSTDRPSTFQRLLDPGGLIWQQQSNTTPLEFTNGGKSAVEPTTPGGPGPMPPNGPMPPQPSTQNPGGVVGPNGPGQITPGTGVADFSSFYRTPDYLVREREGHQSIDRRNAALGSWRSGGADADHMRFASDLGAQGFGSYLDAMFRAAGLGGTSANNVSSAGSQFGSGIGNSSQNMGNARASGYLGAGQAWGDAWNGVGAAAGNYFGNRGWGG